MTISVLLPSRGRPESLRRSVASLCDNAVFDRAKQNATGTDRLATESAGLEILVAYDVDDPETGVAASAISAIAIGFHVRHGYANLHEYYNGLAAQACGDWLLLWNDDATITTTGWDTIIASHDHTKPAVLSLASTEHEHRLCCFPVISRRLIDVIGHFSLSPHCDSWIQDIGRATGCLIDVPINVYHDRYDLTGGHHDQTRLDGEAGYRTNEYYAEPIQRLLREDIDKVRKELAQ